MVTSGLNPESIDKYRQVSNCLKRDLRKAEEEEKCSEKANNTGNGKKVAVQRSDR